MPTPRRDLIFVAAQFALLAGVFFSPTPFAVEAPDRWRYTFAAVKYACVAFGVVAALQLGTSLTPWPSPRAGAALVTHGAYALARHPIYASLLSFAFASALQYGSPLRFAIACALAVLLDRKVRYEERLLTARYPGYGAYAKAVKRFGV